MTQGNPCTKPADCSTGEVCCAKLVLTQNMQQCMMQSHDAKCASAMSCPTMIAFQCTTQQVRLCTASTDCTEPGDPNCCTFEYDAQNSVTFCVGNALALVATSCN